MQTLPDSLDLLPFIQSSATLLGLSLDDARAQRVAEHFGRTAQFAQGLLNLSLSHSDEAVGIYCPAPYPQSLKD